MQQTPRAEENLRPFDMTETLKICGQLFYAGDSSPFFILLKMFLSHC